MGSKVLERALPVPARMVPGCFSKAGGGHENISNPPPEQMRGTGYRKEVGAASKGETDAAGCIQTDGLWGKPQGNLKSLSFWGGDRWGAPSPHAGLAVSPGSLLSSGSASCSALREQL